MDVQHVAQHPPLFYVLLAPLVGPLIAEGNIMAAVGLTRLINIFFGAACVAGLAWGGWLCGGRRKRQIALATAGLAGLIYPFIKVAGDAYNDTLLVLVSTITLCFICLLLRQGPRRSLLVWLGLLSVLGMATRASYISLLFISLLAIWLAFLLHRKSSFLKNTLQAAVINSVIIGLIFITIGWFYIRNYHLSGSWARATASQAWVGRPYRSLTDVITGIDIWIVIPGRLLGLKIWESLLPINHIVSLLISAVAGAGVYIWSRQSRFVQQLRQSRVRGAVFGLLLLHCLLLFGQQLVHATGHGLINPRYFLPMLLPLGLFLAYGLLAWPRVRGLAVSSVMIIFQAAVVMNSMWLLTTTHASLQLSPDPWQRLIIFTVERNHLPAAILPILIGGMLLGSLLSGIALHQLQTADSVRKTKIA